MGKRWKEAEVWWGKFLNGKRHPSQGIRHADVSSQEFVAEHKSRNWDDYSAEFRHAVDQFDDNKATHTDKYPLLLFTFSHGQGKKRRRFMMIEVTEESNMLELMEKLHETARKNTGLPLNGCDSVQEEEYPEAGEEVD